MKISARNQVKGKVVKVQEGAVNGHVTIEDADGRCDLYYSDIEGGSFNKTRKVRRPADPDPGLDPVASSIAADLAGRGLSALELLKPGFRI